MKCATCGEVLSFERGKGYLHPNGKLVIQKLVACEHGGAGLGCGLCGGSGRLLVDDHIAQPISESEHEMGCSSGVGQACCCKSIRSERLSNQHTWYRRARGQSQDEQKNRQQP